MEEAGQEKWTTQLFFTRDPNLKKGRRDSAVLPSITQVVLENPEQRLRSLLRNNSSQRQLCSS